MSINNPVNIAKNLIALCEYFRWKQLTLIGNSDSPENLPVSAVNLQQIFNILKKQKAFKTVLIWFDTIGTSRVQFFERLKLISNPANVLIPFIGINILDYAQFLDECRQLNVSYMQQILFMQSTMLNPKHFEQLSEHYGALFADVILLTDQWDNSSNIGHKFATVEDMVKHQIQSDFDKATWLYLQLIREAIIANNNISYGCINANKTLKHLTVRTFEGFPGKIYFDSNAVRLQPFYVLKLENDVLYEVLKLKLDQICSGNVSNFCDSKFKVIQIQMGNHRIGKRDVDCEKNPELCDEADQTEVVIIIASVMIGIVVIITVLLLYRKLKIGESAQMPWAIPFNAIKIIDFGATNSGISVHSVQPSTNGCQIKPKGLEKDVRLATVGQMYVTLRTYALKERMVFDRTDITLLCKIKQSIHDNLNSFIGICFEKNNELYIMWRHCFRSTLAHFIFENNISGNGSFGGCTRFEDNFKSSFLRDIIRGLDYLHSSPIGYHGSLTTTKCLINNHWILKLSGFGLLRLVYKWKRGGTLATMDNSPIIRNSEIYYFAPEMLNILKSTKTTSLSISNEQGQAADLYAFGIILYEMIFHKRFFIIDERNQEEYENGNYEIFDEAARAMIPNYLSLPNADGVHPNLLELVQKCCSRTPELRPDATLTRKITDAALKKAGSLVDQMIRNMEEYTNNLEVMVEERTRQLEEAQQHAEKLLSELLPASVATELKAGRPVEAKVHSSVTIMYSDIVGFTSLCSESLPMQVVRLLNGVFRKFDMIISNNQCYKVETIGDAYMVAAGIPEEQEHHVCNIALTALQMREFLDGYEIPHRIGQKLHCRWGFNSGSVFSGVVGLSAPRYCIFGETTLLASKMENRGIPDRIQTTFNSYKLLTEADRKFVMNPRGSITIEGFGTLLTYWLEGIES